MLTRKRKTHSALLCIIALILFSGSAKALAQGSACRSVVDGEANLIQFESLGLRGEKSTIEGVFMKADTAAPRPAVILLPTYYGIETPECYRWFQIKLRNWGYHSLLIDHSSPGGKSKRGGQHSLYDRLADIEGAVRFLEKSTSIMVKGIATVGWSQGAVSVLHSLDQKRAFKNRKKIPLQAAVAFYPTCPLRTKKYRAPVLALHGSLDKLAPIGSCEKLAKKQSGFNNFRLVVFSGVGHQFDQPKHKNFDRKNADRANMELKRFLDNNLGGLK